MDDQMKNVKDIYQAEVRRVRQFAQLSSEHVDKLEYELEIYCSDAKTWEWRLAHNKLDFMTRLPILDLFDKEAVIRNLDNEVELARAAVFLKNRPVEDLNYEITTLEEELGEQKKNYTNLKKEHEKMKKDYTHLLNSIKGSTKFVESEQHSIELAVDQGARKETVDTEKQIVTSEAGMSKTPETADDIEKPETAEKNPKKAKDEIAPLKRKDARSQSKKDTGFSTDERSAKRARRE